MRFVSLPILSLCYVTSLSSTFVTVSILFYLSIRSMLFILARFSYYCDDLSSALSSFYRSIRSSICEFNLNFSSLCNFVSISLPYFLLSVSVSNSAILFSDSSIVYYIPNRVVVSEILISLWSYSTSSFRASSSLIVRIICLSLSFSWWAKLSICLLYSSLIF